MWIHVLSCYIIIEIYYNKYAGFILIIYNYYTCDNNGRYIIYLNLVSIAMLRVYLKIECNNNIIINIINIKNKNVKHIICNHLMNILNKTIYWKSFITFVIGMILILNNIT